MSYLIFDAANF